MIKFSLQLNLNVYSLLIIAFCHICIRSDDLTDEKKETEPMDVTESDNPDKSSEESKADLKIKPSKVEENAVIETANEGAQRGMEASHARVSLQ